MAELLSNIPDRFILSLNDHPEVRKLFPEFQIEVMNTRYSANRGVIHAPTPGTMGKTKMSD